MDTIGVSSVVWSPDSRGVAYRSGETIFFKPIGAAAPVTLFKSRIPASPAGYTSDGRTLLFHAADTLFAMPLTGGRSPTVLGTLDGPRGRYLMTHDGAWTTITLHAPR